MQIFSQLVNPAYNKSPVSAHTGLFATRNDVVIERQLEAI